LRPRDGGLDALPYVLCRGHGFKSRRSRGSARVVSLRR
jgi:hypothetical protein